MSRALRFDLISHARRCAPHEACGVIVGDGVSFHYAIEIRNVHHDPENYFQMDEEEQLQAWIGTEERGLSVMAYYHSHVDTPARPSQVDLSACIPGLLSVIVSLATPRPEIAIWDGPIPYGGNITI